MKEQDNWFRLCHLQRQLKKQFLLVQKEQQDKIKLKRQIQELIRSYHSQSIEILYSNGQLLKEDGFDNCYNFIKDVILAISTNIQLGKEIIYLTEERSTIINLIINGFYQNNQTNDPYLKDITHLVHQMVGELYLEELRDLHREHKILETWQLYMHKTQHQNYFQQIATPTLRKLLKVDSAQNKGQNVGQSQAAKKNPLESMWKINNQQALIEQFIRKIQSEAELCSPSIKIPLRKVVSSSCSNHAINKSNLFRVWQLISSFYLRPFIAVSLIKNLPLYLRERILNFVNQLIMKWKFSSQLHISHDPLKQKPHQDKTEIDQQINKICLNLVSLYEGRYISTFIKHQNNNENKIQIKIYGVYISLAQLQDLLILFNSHRDRFSKINDKVITRTAKIFQISPNLKILKRQKALNQFVSLTELRYQESISSDYYKNYSNIYRSERQKQILKQVLVELENISDYKTQYRKTLHDIFKGIVNRNKEIQGKTILTAQLQLKIKYLIHILNSTHSQYLSQHILMQQMENELNHRNITNIKLYEDTKLSLLKVYCNLRNLKNQLRIHRDTQKSNHLKIELTQKLQDLKMNMCITSRRSRNKSEGEQQIVDKYRYLLSSADQILVSPILSCIHKENMFIGGKSHGNTALKCLEILVNLPQVKHMFVSPTFLQVQKQAPIYSYYSENKIGQVFHNLLKEITERMVLQQSQKHMVESILFYFISQSLLGTKYIPLLWPKDRILVDIIQESTTLQNKQIESPRKKPNRRKRKGSQSFIQKTVFSLNENENSRLQQIEKNLMKSNLVQIGSQHIMSLNNSFHPIEKIRKLKEVTELYRLVFKKNTDKSNYQEQLEDLLTKSIYMAKIPNLLANLTYLQMFVAQEKMIASQGKVLKLYEKVVSRILNSGQSFLSSSQYSINKNKQY